jgi:hypothetical protein
MTETIKKVKTNNADSINDCQVIEIGIGDFAECAQWGPVTCEHAIPFGNSILCMHPRVKEMIENTKNRLSAQKI